MIAAQCFKILRMSAEESEVESGTDKAWKRAEAWTANAIIVRHGLSPVQRARAILVATSACLREASCPQALVQSTS